MTHPQARLAALIGGTPQASGAIVVGPHIVTATVAGTVRVCVAGTRPGIAIGHWTDEPEELAAAFHAVVAAAREDAASSAGGA